MINFLLPKSWFPALAGALLLAGCQKEAGPIDNTPNLRPLTTAERQTVGSANDFAYRAFGSLRQADPGSNLCISPLSISAALTMAYNGADGGTKEAMKQVLGVTAQTDQELNQSYQSLFALFTNLDKQVAFSTANSLWYNKNYQLSAPFVQTNQTYFGATVQGLDFASPTAKNTINNWVVANTQGRIPSIIDQTTGDDVLYLLNAIYFKGTWTYRFDQSLTKPEAFHFEDGSTKNVDFMTLKKGKYLRYTDGKVEVIDMPYGNRQFSMTFVVPQGTATLAEVAGRLTAPQLATWLAKADTTGAELHLPKFKLEYKQTLNDCLTQLGMGVAFSNQADFGQMLAAGPKNLKISEVKHRTFLEVNEEGTEAAAVTSVGIMFTTSLGPAAVIRLDRPFLFLLREKATNTVLFIGQLTNP
jgi:serine protease inhibitor